MVKRQICVTVDDEFYILAQRKLGNGFISPTINKFLQDIAFGNSDNNIKELEDSIKELDDRIKILMIEKGSKEYKLECLLVEKKAEDSENQNSSLDRWSCGICKTLNYLEQERCRECNLPMRNGKGTVIVKQEKK